MLVESDEKVLALHPTLAFVFGVTLSIVISFSAIATFIYMGTSFMFHRFIARESVAALECISNETRIYRRAARYLVMSSFLLAFIDLMVYAHAKWSITDDDYLSFMYYGILGFGACFILVILKLLENVNTAAKNKIPVKQSLKKVDSG
eukprot:CAMPEP_0202706524 /NCGR_PEP_ID=MMETSP1385-20130828/18936_1 /ASSEMBLY_ACC=CAM_ASM_000861 /TAXON_ID=933848 /ORGANISM="Elphidium margaritaceum" /LENGTH=147 /DNA_ID=CAMNT_0049365017 /DNA_START=57 /DNA_END=500 /DNA_ORIENTATION=+